jgi:hypothetical protein
MAKLTKTDAARQLGIARSTLYKLIDQGAISSTPDGMIDSTELVRAATVVDRLKERSRSAADVLGIDTQRRGEQHLEHFTDSDHERPRTDVRERLQTSAVDRSQTYADTVVDLLREQLRTTQEAAQQEREAAQERERAYREHIAQLTMMLNQAHQQNQRLLEAPRPPAALPVAVSPSALPGVPAPAPGPREPFPTRGAARQRILTLLRDYPEGLTPAEMKTLLRADTRLTNTCAGMRRDGLLRRVGRGRYVVSDGSP